MKTLLPVLVLVLILTSCTTAPTLQQRQEAWFKYRDATRATCAVGVNDPAMPLEVKAWCAEVVGP